MGCARNLKLGRGNGGQGPGQRGNIFVGGPNVDLSCCVYREDVAGSRGRAPGWGGQRAKLTEAEKKLFAFGHAMGAANLPTFWYLKTQKNHRYLC